MVLNPLSRHPRHGLERRGKDIHPELNMTWGSSCSALKKSWKRYKFLRYTGSDFERLDIEDRINKIQKYVGRAD
jgi:hypothetical protein